MSSCEYESSSEEDPSSTAVAEASDSRESEIEFVKGVLMLHRVVCDGSVHVLEDHSEHPGRSYFLDVPRLYAKDTRASVLRGKRKLKKWREYWEDHHNYRIVVVREYSCVHYHATHAKKFHLVADGFERSVLRKLGPWLHRLPDTIEPAVPINEEIVLPTSLATALTNLTKNSQPDLGHWVAGSKLKEPYDYFYHFRRKLREEQYICQLSSSRVRSDYLILLNFIDQTQGPAFDGIDESFLAGEVGLDNFERLFGPNELVVTSQNGVERALVAEKAVLSQVAGRAPSLNLECWSWSFDGSFRKRSEILTVRWPTLSEATARVERLSVWPLRLDKTGLRERLIKRGHKFWASRHKALVCYDPPTPTVFELQITNPKYMIDYQTYRQMHPSKSAQPLLTNAEMRDLGVDIEDDEPPSDLFCLLLPTSMLGYAFHDKKWRSLIMDHISPVPWNKDAFNRLVMNSRRKDTIKALVMVHLRAVQDVDIVENKGNGLIILLHGSPGTGKTLTAESVAELAEKPLYRVTCADIGTEPGSVEKYMESVLLLGTIWECVVLLDEADVFLEERQVTDLARNALVAVFLRVLEYYDGIMILTTNRVGTFDEAFKSRVQLAIHYPPLCADDRLQIWLNFINVLHEKKVDMKFEELKRRADFLARIPFNGRQIRNLLLTAAQIAKYKHESLDYSHVEQVVEISQEFEQYLLETHGLSDEENARAQRLRQ